MPAVRWAGLAVAAGAVSVLYGLQSANTRLLVSWHGFLHTAIANRFPTTSVPPENPFFAGEPLPYYWFYQAVAAGADWALGVGPMRAFQFLILMSLAMVVLSGSALGRRAFGSAGVGLLAAYLALAGANPAGPLLAGAKHLLRGMPLLNGVPPDVVTQGMFVSNELADAWLTHPLLGALYFGQDWRFGQNLAWFFDISSRAPAIALLMVTLLLLPRPRSWSNLVLIVATSAMLTAVNPVMGLPAASAVAAGVVLIALAGRRRSRDADDGVRPMFAAAVAMVVGTTVAAPTYLHLFLGGQGGTSLTTWSVGAVKWVALTLTFAPVAALAAYGAWWSPANVRTCVRSLAAAGLMLLAATFMFDLHTLRNLERGNEHNLANTALCLLAVPAVAWISSRAGPLGGYFRHPGRLVFLAFLPTTVLTVAAYVGSPHLPIAFEGRTLVRLPQGGALDAFYAWARQTTPADAVFVVDPRSALKMSGNVSELPAFTRRTLFVDQPGYMTDGHRDAGRRRALAVALFEGDGVAGDERDLLRRLARPVYLVSYRGDQASATGDLAERFGAAVFHQGFVAAFRVDPERFPGAARAQGVK